MDPKIWQGGFGPTNPSWIRYFRIFRVPVSALMTIEPVVVHCRRNSPTRLAVCGNWKGCDIRWAATCGLQKRTVLIAQNCYTAVLQ